MTRQFRRCLFFVAFLFCAIFSAAEAPAPSSHSTSPRNFDAWYLGARVMLGPDWLFSPDDNPAYASPDYDDSGWKTGSADLPLHSNPNVPYVWYRFHVHVHPAARFLAVETQYLEGSYELYVNGERIGANGTMKGVRENSQPYLTSYEIPDRMIAPEGYLVLAIRFAVNKAGPLGIGASTPFQKDGIFLSSRDAAGRDASYQASHEIVIPLVLSGLALLIGLVAFALYMAMRSRLEYLAIAISLLASSAQGALIAWTHLHVLTFHLDLLETLAISVNSVAFIEFVRLILRIRRTRLLLVLEVANFLGYFSRNLAVVGLLSTIPTLFGYFLPALVVQAVMAVLMMKGLLRGNRDARVIFPAITIISVANYWNFFSFLSGIGALPFSVPALPSFYLGTYYVDFWFIWNAIYGVTMLLFLVLRTIGIARERARAAAELEAARIVQLVLIPHEIPSVPGFQIASVYKPAGEVGGDFFQIVAMKAGGVLVVIGDVSGKGMPAAMTVSLLVGTFRTLAHYTDSPAEILAAMNMRMLARSNGGFTTCLVLRSDANGTLTIANAGHVPPYLAGKELSLENGLPLGLAADTTYTECSFQFAPGQQITLLTDGVIEARDNVGALLGFERSAAMSTETAETIARIAQAFGQEDDITVLTLSYAGVPVSA